MRTVQPAKLALVARGETQTEVARAIGYRRVTLNLVLNGLQRPSAPLKAKLAAHLGMTEDELFFDDAA